MNCYVKISNQTIQIIPKWKFLKKSYDLTPYDEGLEVSKLALNNQFYIPLKSFNNKKVPNKVTLFYGNKEYDTLDEIVNEVYNSRSYSTSEDRAKRNIENLLVKAVFDNKKVYGKEISYKFDFIDTSNFDIQI